MRPEGSTLGVKRMDFSAFLREQNNYSLENRETG
jgi:hypothetical protein